MASKEDIIPATHKINLETSKFIGKKVKRVDNLNKVTGKEQYGIDGGIKKALSAVLIPFPEFGSVPLSCNKKELLKLEGIRHVLKISNGFAIVADKYWQAIKAKEEFKGHWKRPKNLFNSSNYHKECQSLTKNYKGKELLDEGDEYKKLDQEIEVEYSVPMSGISDIILPPANTAVASSAPSAGGAAPASTSGAVTGVIIDARGLNARPAMAPQILDQQGSAVYGPGKYSREYAVTNGVVGYSKTLEAAQKDPRVMGNPLILKGISTSGVNRTDIKAGGVSAN